VVLVRKRTEGSSVSFGAIPTPLLFFLVVPYFLEHGDAARGVCEVVGFHSGSRLVDREHLCRGLHPVSNKLGETALPRHQLVTFFGWERTDW